MKVTDVIKQDGLWDSPQGKSKGMITKGFEEDWGFGDDWPSV